MLVVQTLSNIVSVAPNWETYWPHSAPNAITVSPRAWEVSRFHFIYLTIECEVMYLVWIKLLWKMFALATPSVMSHRYPPTVASFLPSFDTFLLSFSVMLGVVPASRRVDRFQSNPPQLRVGEEKAIANRTQLSSFQSWLPREVFVHHLEITMGTGGHVRADNEPPNFA